MGPEAAASAKARATLGWRGQKGQGQAPPHEVRQALHEGLGAKWHLCRSPLPPAKSRAWRPGLRDCSQRPFAGPQPLSDWSSGLFPGWLAGDTDLQEGCLALVSEALGVLNYQSPEGFSRAEGGQLPSGPV